MRTVTTTPFGTRPVTAGLMEHQARGRAEPAIGSVDKWQVLNALGLIARDYGIGDRTLSVLQVLLSFHPDQVLRDGTSMVVFASNAAICDRAHGMPESTLRRHIAALVEAGLILRHDSPNGKRYARRGRGGEITRAFGFDLRPLLVLAPEIAARAAEETARREHVDAMREEVSLLLRDAQRLGLSPEVVLSSQQQVCALQVRYHVNGGIGASDYLLELALVYAIRKDTGCRPRSFADLALGHVVASRAPDSPSVPCRGGDSGFGTRSTYGTVRVKGAYLRRHREATQHRVHHFGDLGVNGDPVPTLDLYEDVEGRRPSPLKDRLLGLPTACLDVSQRHGVNATYQVR